MTDLIPLVVLCGVGADLCTFPLFMLALLSVTGFVQVHPAAPWLASYWMVGFSLVLLIAEIALDTQANRRQRFYRRAWPAIQHVVSAVVTVTVVAALGAQLSWPERVTALGVGWAVTGVVRGGLVERFKLLLGLAGGH